MTTQTTSQPLVSVRVKKLLPFGLLVSFEDGTPGLIREREIAWNHWGRRGWRERFQVGDIVQAVALGTGHNQRLELSLRLAENDPWTDLPTRYALGQIVSGTITGIQPYGVFVEIEPGITGLLHRSRLPLWVQNRATHDLFWLGDQVKVVIERIDIKNRQLSLHLGRAWQRRWQHSVESQTTIAPNRDLPSVQETAESSPLELPPLQILVIEDDPAQLEAMAKWMRNAGLRIITATSAEAALTLLADEQPDLVLSDFWLPKMNGIAAINQIRSRWPQLRCALMTDWARINEYIGETEVLRSAGVPVLIKPLLPGDIIDLLINNEAASMELPTAATCEQEQAAPISTSNPLGSHMLQQHQLRDRLGQLCAATAANKAIIFVLDPAQRMVGIVAEAGMAALNLAALSDLIHSPVRDVAEDQQTFRIDDTQQAESRVRYLKPLLPFRSCLGMRLPMNLAENYALFLFSSQPNAFMPQHEEHMAATCLAAGAMLERERFQSHAVEMQRLALLGQLSRALVHEINHRLSPINFVLSDIGYQVNRLEQDINQASPAARQTLNALRDTMLDLTQGIERLTETARLFGQMTAQAREQSVDPGAVVVEVVQLLRDTADRANIHLDISIPDELPLLHLQAVQLQQILLNIVINAIQQIQLLRPSSGGRTQIRVETQAQHAHPMIRIFIEDDGPGIHRTLWQRIFELGFTTRSEGGSGLGLYITRSLAESLRGHVSIVESYILWGTTFLVELPCVV